MSAGVIFKVTNEPPGFKTETCRACEFSITYRERPSPQQRNKKYQHDCAETQTSQEK